MSTLFGFYFILIDPDFTDHTVRKLAVSFASGRIIERHTTLNQR